MSEAYVIFRCFQRRKNEPNLRKTNPIHTQFASAMLSCPAVRPVLPALSETEGSKAMTAVYFQGNHPKSPKINIVSRQISIGIFKNCSNCKRGVVAKKKGSDCK